MNKKKKLDEREIMEMYKIEHYGFWFMYWALLASIFIQFIFFDASIKQVCGEWVVFMIAAVASSIAYYRGGHYDYSTEPGIKSYLMYSVVFTIIFDVIVAIGLYVHHNYYNITGFIITIVLFAVMLFVVLFAALSIIGEATKKRRRKLEEQLDDSNDQENKI